VGVVLLDSAVLAGFLDRGDALHPSADRRIREIAGRERLIASVVTYAELLTGVALGHHAEDSVRGLFVDLIDEIVPVDVKTAERAARIRAVRRSLRLPDALILASAERQEADLVISGDERWTGITGFACDVEILAATTGRR
jgi:predicted nucleic acid-binding protein